MLTKKQALAAFRAEILPLVRAKYGRHDRIAVSEAWCDYTDALCKDRQITSYQDRTWTNPF
jgi:hypothetical protein